MTESVKSYFADMLKRMEPKTWVPCPCCREDWNRLEPNKFWWKGKMEVAYICPVCARSVRSIRWVSKTYDIPFFDVSIYRLPAFANLHPRDQNDRQLAAEFLNGHKMFCRGDRVEVHSPAGENRVFENVIQAMIASGKQDQIKQVESW